METKEPKQAKTGQHQKERYKKLLEILDKVPIGGATIQRGSAEPRNKAFMSCPFCNP